MEKPGVFGFASAVVIGGAVVWAMSMLSGAIVRSRGADEMIRVTGSARKEIRSDFIIWSGRVAYRAPDIPTAYKLVKDGIQKSTKFLTDKGVDPAQIVTSSVTTSPVYETVRRNQDGYTVDSQQISGYELSQTLEVRSNEVEKVDKLSREVTDLISTGVNFESYPPKFLYTKISEVKVEILAEAAKDARRRAEEIAKSSGTSLSDVRFARMSPLQITPLYSTEVTYDGQNDTTAVDKAITAIVTMGFGVK